MMLGEDYLMIFSGSNMSGGREVPCPLCKGTDKNPDNENEKCPNPSCYEGKIWIGGDSSLRRMRRR